MEENDKKSVNNVDKKKRFEQLSEIYFGKTTAEYILKTQELCLNKIDKHNNAFQEILNTIKSVFNI
ncbi:MAG: hypothetical protein LBH25_02285 [Fibromonadaceae bacterium]|jgi:hypothetical protein|nr:hypothetical protein [Fibromonadaceae bacterium]